jgi:hypothetical protein
LGRIIFSPGAYTSGRDFYPLLDRHGRGDWGDICDHDRELNDEALETKGLLFSSYAPTPSDPPGTPVLWIVTEADHKTTTVATPGEYI